MKKNLLIAGAILALGVGGYYAYNASAVTATTYYVSPQGNDANSGTQASPWKTLKKATGTVTTEGDTIRFLAGMYTETQTSYLAKGVSLVGDGATGTIIKSAVTGQWSTLLQLESNSLTDGNQVIDGLTFDGQYVSESNVKTWLGIVITLRSNVILQNCVIQGFFNRGVIFNGNGRNESTIPVDPKIYSTGNKVLNCRFINTAGKEPGGGTIFGQLNISGQSGMEVIGNDMNQTQRVASRNGQLIKYWGSGYNMGLKILNNNLKRANFTGPSYNGDGDWNFAIELFNNSGLEIAGNNIQGSIDLNYNRVVAPYTYSFWIHDNISNHTPANGKEEQGIILEFETSKAIIENNQFFNQAMGITFNVRSPNNNGGYNNPKPVGGYSAVTDVIVRNNLFANLYAAPNSAAGIQFLTEGDSKDAYARNILVENNTFVTTPGDEAISGIDLSHFTAAAASSNGFVMQNNIFLGFNGQCLEGGSTKMLNTVWANNCVFACGNSNNPAWTGSLTNVGTIKENPMLDANYLVPANAPSYLRNVGYRGSQAPPPPPNTNIPPTANAGADVTLTLPTNAVTLQGVGTDIDGHIVSRQWKNQAGQAIGIFDTLQLKSLTDGAYTYTYTVMDDSGAVASDQVLVTVNPASQPNQPPVIQSITVTQNNITLKGFGTDPDGTVMSYNWTKVSGGAGTIKSPNSATTVVSGLKAGAYVFQLKITDNKGAIATRLVTINN